MGKEGTWHDVTQFCWNVFFPGRATAVSYFACLFFLSVVAQSFVTVSLLFVSTSGPTPSSTVPLLPTPVASLAACYLTESLMTACSIASWTLPPTLACVLRCRYNLVVTLNVRNLRSVYHYVSRFLTSGAEATAQSVILVQNATVCVSSWREDGCGIWETLGVTVL